MEAHLMPCAMTRPLGFGLGAAVVDVERGKSLHCCQKVSPLEAILVLEILEEMSGLFFMTCRPDVDRYMVVQD